MSDEPATGQDFGSYHIEQRLGGGGFGSVWRAHDRNGTVVALKILTGKFATGDSGRIRSEVELLAAAASSESPNVVRILGGGTDPSPHIAMEFIDGENLEEVLDAKGALTQQETIRVVREIAQALVVLERAGIVHRDVKPANVMIARDGVVKLTDFGIAKIVGYESVTATGQLPLSAAYAAPEAWAGEPTAQSDIYALGAVAFQCLTGERPFNGSFVQLYELHRSKDPDLGLLPASTVPSLRRMIVGCLAKTPELRPRGAAAVIDLLVEAERELSVQQPPSLATAQAMRAPRALGPWIIQAPDPVQPWAFLCTHETSGETAAVEVHFTSNLELGDQFRRALAANPKLVPLGAERLLGTNRLLLRPDEAWPDQPAAQFMFWVAREALSRLGTQNDPLSAEQARALAIAGIALVDAARAEGLELSFSAATAEVSESGTLHLRRVGLTPADWGSIVTWLRSLKLTAEASGLFDSVRDEAVLRTLLGTDGVEPGGVAQIPEDVSSLSDQSLLASSFWEPRIELSGVTSIQRPPQLAEPVATPTESVVPIPADPGIITGSADAPIRFGPKRHRRWRLFLVVGAVPFVLLGLVGAVTLATAALVFTGNPSPCVKRTPAVDPAAAAQLSSDWLEFMARANGGPTSITLTESEITSRAVQYLKEKNAPVSNLRVYFCPDGHAEAAGSISLLGRNIKVVASGTLALTGSQPELRNNSVRAGNLPGQLGTWAVNLVLDVGNLKALDVDKHLTGISFADGTTTITGAPIPTAAVEVLQMTKVSAGGAFGCEVNPDRTVTCWGDNTFGQATAPSGAFNAVTSGARHACGLRIDNSVLCWGDNTSRQATPPAGEFLDVSAGYDFTCAVGMAGAVICWGNGARGIANPPSDLFVSVASGYFHACGIKTDGAVACWGDNTYHQATPPVDTFTSLTAGTFHTCGITAAGTVACWGDNNDHQTSSPNGRFISVGAGDAHSCGVRVDGSISCWGRDNYGQSEPPAGNFVTVSAGMGFACAVRADRTVTCWGDNRLGQGPVAAPTAAAVVTTH